MEENFMFSLTHIDSLSNEEYSVYAILIFPNLDESEPQTVAILPVNRETLDINIVNVFNHFMPIGAKAKMAATEDQGEMIVPESIRDAVIPRILMLLSMTITGYNFLDPEAQVIAEISEKLDVAVDDLPEAEKFEFNTAEDLFKIWEDE